MCSSTPGANDWIVCQATTATDLSVSTSNVVISTTGASDYGVRLSNTYSSWAQGESANVSIEMTGGSITTTGRTAYGVYARMSDSSSKGDVTIDLTRVAISATGNSAHGVNNWHSGSGAQVIRMTGGSIKAGRIGVYAYRTRGGTQTVELSDGVTVSTTGTAHGVYALRVGGGAQTVRMTGGSITTTGRTAHGVYAYSISRGSEILATVDLTGVDVSTMGAEANGVYSRNSGDGAQTVRMTGGSITTTGAYATGLYAFHTGATGKLTIDVDGGAIIKTNGSHGVYANDSTSDGTAITLSDVSIETQPHEADRDNTRIAAVYVERTGRRADDGTKGDLVIDLTKATLIATPTALYGGGVLARDEGLGDIRVNFGSGLVRTGGVDGRGVEARKGFSYSAPDGSVVNNGNWGDDVGRGSIAVTIGAEARIEAPFSIGVRGMMGNPKVGTGRIVVEHAGEMIEARDAGIFTWAARWSGSTFGEGYEATTDDAARTEPMIHVTSSGDIRAGSDVMDDFIRAVVAGADGTLSTAEQRVLDAIVEDGDPDAQEMALGTALDALPASYTDDYKAEARALLASRTWAPDTDFERSDAEADRILGLPAAGIRALVHSHNRIAEHVKDGDVDSTLDRFWPPLTEQEQATLDAQRAFTDPEREILRAVLAGGEGLESLLDALPADYTDDWKNETRRLALLYNEGDVRVDVTGGTIVSEGYGIDARYAVRHERNGAIEVSVAEGAAVTGGVAGIHVAGAGLGDLAMDSEWGRSLNLDADVTGLRQQFVTVHGTVMGGTDAAVHLVGGGILHVGPTGKVLAGSSGNGVLMDGLAHVHIQGEARGAEGEDAAAVHLTGGGSVRVGETGKVLANGAAAAIRADDPDGDTPAAKVVLELGTSEGVEDNDGVAREAVLSLLERVKGPISISGGSGQPVIALVGAAAPGAVLEGEVLNEDGTLGGVLVPENFSWGPCPAGQVSENTGVCRLRVDVDDDRDGRPDGHGIDASYVFPDYRNGAIEVSVAEGATVTGALAGIYVEGAGLGDVPMDWRTTLKLDDDADVTDLRQQYVTVHGTVTGGSDAAVHLVGGGMLYVGPTGKVLAGSSGNGVLVNDPGVAHFHIRGEVKGAEGGAAAVHLTGGGSVRVGETGKVLANGAAAAIRADDPDGDTPAAKVVLELGTSEGVEDNDGVAREDVQSLLDRVKGPISISGGSGQPVIALGGAAAPGATLEGDVLNEDGTLGGVLDPKDFTPRPCSPPQEPGDDGVCRTPPPTKKSPMVVGFDCDEAAFRDDPRCRMYQALPSMLLAMNDLPTYEERTSAARDARGGWARVEVAGGKWKADSATQQKADASKLLENVAYDYRRHGVRAGMDFAMGDAGGVGVSVHGLRGSAEMALVGEVDLSGRGLGLHATTAFAGSFHVDAQAAVTWYDADLESASSGVLKKNVSGRGHALGVEIGRRMALRDGLSVAPRAGLTWSKANLDDFAEDLGYGSARVSVEDARSLKGRVGVGVEKMQGDAMDGARLFGSLDLEREFREETEAQVSGMSPGSAVTSLKAKAERTAFRLAVGSARVWGEGRYSLQGSVGYTAGGGDNRDLGGGLSFVMRF